jgi:hypothetical protein
VETTPAPEEEEVVQDIENIIEGIEGEEVPFLLC